MALFEMEFSYLYICSHGRLNGQLIDDQGFQALGEIVKFDSVEEAESYLEKNDIRANCCGFDYENPQFANMQADTRH